VLNNRFEDLKRYNLAEIFDPTPKEAVPARTDDISTSVANSQGHAIAEVPRESADQDGQVVEQPPAAAAAVMDLS
jgi:hypothetical protein